MCQPRSVRIVRGAVCTLVGAHRHVRCRCEVEITTQWRSERRATMGRTARVTQRGEVLTPQLPQHANRSSWNVGPALTYVKLKRPQSHDTTGTTCDPVAGGAPPQPGFVPPHHTRSILRGVLSHAYDHRLPSHHCQRTCRRMERTVTASLIHEVSLAVSQ